MTRQAKIFDENVGQILRVGRKSDVSSDMEAKTQPQNRQPQTANIATTPQTCTPLNKNNHENHFQLRRAEQHAHETARKTHNATSKQITLRTTFKTKHNKPPKQLFSVSKEKPPVTQSNFATHCAKNTT